MPKAIRLLRIVVLPSLIAVALSACAIGRSVVDVDPPVSTAPVSGAHFVKIVAVNDLRHFEAAPSDAERPRLESSADIDNKAITSHAMARKRGGFGMAIGDVVLPDNKTVADLVRAAAQKALQDKGYTVVGAAAPQYAAAQPLSIDIDALWSWFSPGAFTVTIEFKSKLQLTGDAVVGPGGVTVTNDVSNRSSPSPTEFGASCSRAASTTSATRSRPKCQPPPPACRNVRHLRRAPSPRVAAMIARSCSLFVLDQSGSNCYKSRKLR